MSDARPSLVKRQTRAGRKARQAEMDQGVTIRLDGREYTVRSGEMSGQLVRHLRRETGYSFRGLMEAAQRDPDIDIIETLVWLARRQDGEHLLSLDDVDLGYGDLDDLDIVEAAPEEPDPEA